MSKTTQKRQRLSALVSIAALGIGAVTAALPAQSASAAGLTRGIALRIENATHHGVVATADVGTQDVLRARIEYHQNAVLAGDRSRLDLHIACQTGPASAPVKVMRFANPDVGIPFVEGLTADRLHLAEGRHVTVTAEGIKFYIERKHDDTYTTNHVKTSKSFIVRVEAC